MKKLASKLCMSDILVFNSDIPILALTSISDFIHSFKVANM